MSGTPGPGRGSSRLRGFVFLLLAIGLAAASVYASRAGWVERARNKIWGRAPRLSAGDFPAGVSAPVDVVASVPTRPTLVGVVPRGAVAPLLWAAGDDERVGLFRAAYALDVQVRRYPKEDDLKRALIKGGEAGGVDVAVLPASSLAMSSLALRDAAPRAVMLLARSRGLDVLGAAPGIKSPVELAGKRIGTEPKSASHYFALWVLSRAGLTLRDVTLVPLDSTARAGEALRRGEVDAAAGTLGDVGPAVKEKGGTLVSTTADAPHLVAWVLAARGEFLARYPDAMRRLVRGALDANAQALKDSGPAVLALGSVAPELGDPNDVLAAEPPAQLKDNLAFFGLAGEAPVTYQELYQSAVALQAKVLGQSPPTDVDDTADPSVLKYVSAAKP